MSISSGLNICKIMGDPSTSSHQQTKKFVVLRNYTSYLAWDLTVTNNIHAPIKNTVHISGTKLLLRTSSRLLIIPSLDTIIAGQDRGMGHVP